jgi:hypothetical protein
MFKIKEEPGIPPRLQLNKNKKNLLIHKNHQGRVMWKLIKEWMLNLLLTQKNQKEALSGRGFCPVIAQVVGWENPDPTTEQVLQHGNPTPNVTSM